MAMPVMHNLREDEREAFHPPPDSINFGEKAKAKIYGPAPGTEGYLPDTLSAIGMIQLAQSVDNMIPWSYYPLHRDRLLRRYYKNEPMMSGCVYTLTARIKALTWRLDGGRNSKMKFQDTLGNANDGAGFSDLLGKTLTDIYTQDNGAHWLLDGPGNPLRPIPYVKGVIHLDSEQCWRTHDTEFPILYTNPYTGTFHKLHRSRVVSFSSFPQPDELARSIGFCGVSRAFKLMQFMRNVGIYKDEKVSGNFKRGIIFGTGYTPKSWTQAMMQADEADDSRGLTTYRGIPILLSQHEKAALDMLDLASLPDGFDYEKELTLYIYALALIFGVDAREFWPATASGATKADATIQHLKAQGKGFADVIQMIERAINWLILPGGLEFKFDYTDDEQDLRSEEIRKVKTENINLLKTMGIIDARGAQILCVYRGVMTSKELEAISEAAEMETTTDQADGEAPLGPDGDPLILPELPEPELPPGFGDNPDDEEDDEEGKGKPPQFGQKAITYKGLRRDKNKYANLLESTLTKWAEGLATATSPFDNLDAKLDDLITDYLAQMRRYTSYAYRQGTNGNPVSKTSLEQLKQVGATSEKYFRESFIPDLKASILATRDSGTKGLGDDIKAAVSSFTSRIRSYAGAFWESIWVGFGGALGKARDRQVKRVLDPTTENCDPCKNKAGTYSSFSVMMNSVGLPGDGSTPCLGNCHCYVLIEQEDGSFIHLPGKGASISYEALY